MKIDVKNVQTLSDLWKFRVEQRAKVMIFDSGFWKRETSQCDLTRNKEQREKKK